MIALRYCAAGIALGALAALAATVLAPQTLVDLTDGLPSLGAGSHADAIALERTRADIEAAHLAEGLGPSAAIDNDPMKGVLVRSTWRMGERAGALIEMPDGRPRHIVLGDLVGEAKLTSVGGAEATFSTPRGDVVVKVVARSTP